LQFQSSNIIKQYIFISLKEDLLIEEIQNIMKQEYLWLMQICEDNKMREEDIKSDCIEVTLLSADPESAKM